MKEFDIVSNNGEGISYKNTNPNNNLIKNYNNINLDYKKSLSSFKENKTYINTISSINNEDNLKTNKNKKFTESLISENNKLIQKVKKLF